MNSIYSICTQNPLRQWHRTTWIYLLVASVSKPPSDTFYHHDVMRNPASPALSLCHWCGSSRHHPSLNRFRCIFGVSFTPFPLGFDFLCWLSLFVAPGTFSFAMYFSCRHRKHPSLLWHPVARLEHLHSVCSSNKGRVKNTTRWGRGKNLCTKCST